MSVDGIVVEEAFDFFAVEMVSDDFVGWGMGEEERGRNVRYLGRFVSWSVVVGAVLAVRTPFVE